MAIPDPNNPLPYTAPGGGGGGTQMPGGGGQDPTVVPLGNNFPGGNGSPNNFNLPQFGGPFAAPLTAPQMDALQAFRQLFTGQPAVTTDEIRQGIQMSLTGNPIFHPQFGKSLQETIAPFQLPSAARTRAEQFAGGAGAPATSTFDRTQGIIDSLTGAAPSFDTTEMFRTGEHVFQSDLAKELARIKEEYSGLGLSPGSTDRADRLATTAGDAIARFRLGQQDIARQAFESAQGRTLAGRQTALPIQAGVEQTPFNQSMELNQFQAAVLPFLAAMEEQPFQRYQSVMEPAANRAASTLPYLFQAEDLPFQRAMQLFGMGEMGRQVADTELVRRNQEYARTQGGIANLITALLGGSPAQNTAVGPSPASQNQSNLLGWASILAPLLSVGLDAYLNRNN